MKPANSLGITGRLGDRVYQHVAPGLGNVEGDTTRTLQNRAYVAHNSSHTSAQLAQRAKFRDAVSVWHVIDDGTKAEFRTRAKSRAISGFNLWMSEHLRG